MKNSKNIAKLSVFATGSLLIGSLTTSAVPVSTAVNNYSYDILGTGGQVRSEILNSNYVGDYLAEAACGNKTSEAKCGEGKCGEKKNEKSEKKTEKKESKESKKSGKESKKSTKKTETKENKTSEHKCGEGKCGEGKCGSELN